MEKAHSMEKDDTWKILDKLFCQSGSGDCPNSLVRHQIESFNEFLDKKLIQIIQGFNPIQVCYNYSQDISDFKYKINLNIMNPSLTKPIYQNTDGSQILMTPNIARMNNLTYSSNLYVDIHVIIDIINDDGVTERKETNLKAVCIAKLPIMVRSKACVLTQLPGIAEGEGKYECIYDFGGYFICNGNEKVVISQDRISENKTLVFQPNGNGDGLYAEIRSMPDGMFLPPKTTNLHLSGKSNHAGNIIRLTASFLKSDIPLFVMFRALGIESDKEIYAHIVYDLDDPKQQRIIQHLSACAEDACDIHTQDDAFTVLLKILGTTGTPKEYLENRKTAVQILKNTIRNDFLSHTGTSYKKKALYLGYMVKKLLSIYLGYKDYDNRDSYLHKRIDTPGVLYSNLFRQCYGKLIKEVRNLIVRELNLWRANPSVPLQLINQNNIHRFFKQSVIETGLRYALSTGNWGVKTIGSFQNIRQGVAQVLNRMSHLSTLSHLRRINTPMEKNGKLVQPRKLENSQYGMICPNETPEGSSVGLVKNIALSTHITVNVSSIFVRTTLKELGTIHYDDTVTDSLAFLKEMGNPYSVHILINGDIIGYHRDPQTLYNKLKHMKRYGIIPSITAIIWDVQSNSISLSTEAGRMCRPLYIVKNKELEINNILKRKNIGFDEFIKDKVFQNFIAPMTEEDEEGFVEYMDTDEIDKAMVAMFPYDLVRGIKGTTLPPQFTHCEMDPSLLNGVLAANIPFMDHNQAPRNCYQCLAITETVLMADGTLKMIKDVVVGDEVVCFNIDTLQTYNTYVIHQYERVCTKRMYRITTISGRSILATHDHKFITENGWQDVDKFMTSNNTRLAIFNETRPLNTYIDEKVIIDSLYDSSNKLMSEWIINNLINKEILPFKTTHKHISIIARIVGYICNSGSIDFESTIDNEKFLDDVRFIGFPDYRDSAFILLMQFLNAFNVDEIPSWIQFCSDHTKREFCAGYMSRIDNNDLIPDKIKDLIDNFNENALNNAYEFMDTIGYPYSTTKNSGTLIIAEYIRYSEFAGIMGENNKMEFDTWVKKVKVQGNMIWVPIYSVLNAPKMNISDITVESENHSFIGGDGFAVSNSAMGKQALGIYMTNYNQRIDTMAHVLHYPQMPLVRTKLSKYTYSQKMPSGVNAIVAIMTYTGFNQEDSVMINESALDRGLFTSTYFKSYRDQCSKNHSTGEEEEFTKPIITETVKKGKVKPFNYDKLDANGFVPKNTYVDSRDILLGKMMPHKGGCDRDTSLQIKGNDDGHIDMNYCGTNGDGYKFAKIRLRKYRKLTVGDKCASRHAQKGSTGMIYKQKDMPFTKDGIVPDIIMNPHAIPSRMTIAQLMECIMGKAATHLGTYGNATPFTDCTVEGISKVLETSGFEKYGNEILYNGRTGEQIKTEIFIGPVYYQRLKHMVADKAHCLLPDRYVLCENSWKKIQNVKITDKVAVLKDGELVYEYPEKVLEFPHYDGEMYHISNQAIDLDVTINHKMYVSELASASVSELASASVSELASASVSERKTRKRIWSKYQLIEAGKIIGQHVKYKKDAEWTVEDYQFILPKTDKNEEKIFDMNIWLTFFGIWMAKGWAHDERYRVALSINKERVKDVLFNAVNKMGYNYQIFSEKLEISDKQLHAYMAPLSVEAPAKRLPEWCFKLSKDQSRKLLYAMQLGENISSIYYTSSIGLADDFQRLCIHAGWSGIIRKHLESGNKEIISRYDVWIVSVIKTRNNPSVNHSHHKSQDIQKEYTYHYQGPVYCLTVSSGVFMVRHNGKSVWTGNSRGSNGPIILLTRQPAEGRARNGGLRYGEMERDATVGHGASLFLKERMIDVSDNFRAFVCRTCGLLAVANPEKNIYRCNKCKSGADIVQIRLPYAMKLLMQELLTMNVAPRISV